jgi:hypothetical protein
MHHVNRPVQGHLSSKSSRLNRLDVLGLKVLGKLWKREASTVGLNIGRVAETQCACLAGQVENISYWSHVLIVCQTVDEHEQRRCLAELGAKPLHHMVNQGEDFDISRQVIAHGCRVPHFACIPSHFTKLATSRCSELTRYGRLWA